MEVNIDAEVDGHTLEQFANLIQQRKNLLNETTAQSIAACAINLLKSLRASTAVANLNNPLSGEIEDCPELYYGLKREKGGKPQPCLRFAGSNAQFNLGDDARFVIIQKGLHAKDAKIFSWKRKSGKVYYIAARSKKDAEKWKKELEKKRIKKYRGLAKHALGRLMHKVASTTNVSDAVDAAAQTVAEQNTNVMKENTGFNSGRYTITVSDQLNYALDALKGGESEFTNALQRSMNTITSIINTKCKNVLGFEKLEIPFPKE